MKIKTVSTGKKEDFDDMVSHYSEQLKGKYTQTHVTVKTDNSVLYTAVIFY